MRIKDLVSIRTTERNQRSLRTSVLSPAAIAADGASGVDGHVERTSDLGAVAGSDREVPAADLSVERTSGSENTNARVLELRVVARELLDGRGQGPGEGVEEVVDSEGRGELGARGGRPDESGGVGHLRGQRAS